MDTWFKLLGAAEDGTRLLVIRANGKGLSGGFDFTGIEEQTDAELVLRFIRVETLYTARVSCAICDLIPGTRTLFRGCGRPGGCLDTPNCNANGQVSYAGLMFGVVLGTQRLAQSLGTTKARHILETTRLFNASEAVELGFLHSTASEEGWTGIEQERYQAAIMLPIDAQRQMLARTIRDTRDSDLAALVRSVSGPGIKARIMEYVAEMQKQRKSK